MAVSLLTTKFYIPTVRFELVSRPRLLGRIKAGLNRKLTLISAPAGFGKTTLLSEWIGSIRSRTRVAWLSLDEGDNDPTRFWTYFGAALQTIPILSEAGVGETFVAALQSPQPPPIEALLTGLINEIATVSGPPLIAAPEGAGKDSGRNLALVLDDFHVITAQQVYDGVAFALDNLPPQLHLIIATRVDPPLNIARLRVRGQMTELRADDLRFTPHEAALFLNQVMSLDLSQEEVAALAARTEGWIAGLHVAAMAMQGREDVSSFIAAFSGGHRYILSYLVEEVLQRQPECTRTFLLQTAILDRLSGSLCDAVTNRSDGPETLEYLEDANLFIVPMDDERRWYRYHRLFGDVLRARLEREFEAQEIQTLQRRASDWCDQHGLVLQAVYYALEAQDHEHVVALIERHIEEIFQRCEFNTLVAWIRALPTELVSERPLLSMIYAWALLNIGHLDEVEACLRNIEQAVGASADVLGAGSAEHLSLAPQTLGALVEVTVVRCNLAVHRLDIPLVLELSQRVLPFVEDDTIPYLFNPPSALRPVVIFNIALAYEFSGRLGAASQAFAEAAELGREQRNQFIALLAMSGLARLQVLRGQLREAEKACQQALRWGAEMAGPSSPIVGYARIGLGNLLYERNALDAALVHLEQGIALLKPWHNLEGLLFGYIGLARTKRAQGDWDGSFEAVDEMVELCSTPDAQMLSPVVETLRAALWIERGNLDAAGQWAERSGLSADGDLVYLREGETLVFARVLIAQERLDEALRLLSRLLATAQNGGRRGRVIEILALQAVVLQAQGKQAEALTALERALALAEPEGYARVFIDEGEVMAALLSQVDILPGYVSRLLASLASETPAGTDGARRQTKEKPALSTEPDQSFLAEPLSDRELELLRLIAAGSTNRAIAESLMVSVNTVKTHARNIYGKLGVHNRTQAATRARELGLL